MNHSHVPYQDIGPNDCRMIFGRDMHHRTVLNISSLSDADVIDVATEHHVEPDARLRPNMSVTDDRRIGGNKSIWRDDRMGIVPWQDDW